MWEGSASSPTGDKTMIAAKNNKQELVLWMEIIGGLFVGSSALLATILLTIIKVLG